MIQRRDFGMATFVHSYAVRLQRTFLFFIFKAGALLRPDMLGAVGAQIVKNRKITVLSLARS